MQDRGDEDDVGSAGEEDFHAHTGLESVGDENEEFENVGGKDTGEASEQRDIPVEFEEGGTRGKE